MFLFQRLLQVIRGWFRPRGFHLDVHTLESLQIIAKDQRSTPEEVAAKMVEEGLLLVQQRRDAVAMWSSLTPREQEVAALVCLNYTSRQISARLHISPETVKSHTGHILVKFNVSNRNQLRTVLGNWDFSEWEDM